MHIVFDVKLKGNISRKTQEMRKVKFKYDTLCYKQTMCTCVNLQGAHTHTHTYTHKIHSVPSPQDVEPSRNEAYDRGAGKVGEEVVIFICVLPHKTQMWV